MRVLVCAGGRDFDDAAYVDRVLTDQTRGFSLVVAGGAKGLDTWVEKWCRQNSVPFLRYPARWVLHGKAAGPIRNGAMLAMARKIDGEGFPRVVVFPGGRWDR